VIRCTSNAYSLWVTFGYFKCNLIYPSKNAHVQRKLAVGSLGNYVVVVVVVVVSSFILRDLRLWKNELRICKDSVDVNFVVPITSARTDRQNCEKLLCKQSLKSRFKRRTCPLHTEMLVNSVCYLVK
jgi:hypothetical protein